MSRIEAQDFFKNFIMMAPMARGGNLPYRRLCRDFGAQRTCSEMILADKLVRGGDRPLLRHHESEDDFGVQLTGKKPDVMADAAVIAVEHGANFIDLNFGCPIDLIVKRGAGAALLQRPQRLAEIVQTVRQAVDVPLSVKIRLGYSEKKMNCVKIAKSVEEVGADAVSVHGRTRAQRYRLSANWDKIDEVARELAIPVIGNGDLMTPWDLERRRQETSVSSFLVARGALIKPWVFQELNSGQPLEQTVTFRWSVLRTYVDYAMEYFGDDDHGMKRVKQFFIWHLDFWNRARNWTHEDYLAELPGSLIQKRAETISSDDDLELLASSEMQDFEIIWNRVIERDFPAE